MAGVTGLEPATSGLTGQRSNQLSYTPMGQRTRFYRATAPCPHPRRRLMRQRIRPPWKAQFPAVRVAYVLWNTRPLQPLSDRPEPGSVSALRTSLDRALAARDRPRPSRRHRGGRLRTITVPDLYTLVLGPLLSDTGSAWQAGVTRVWEEHYASATVRTIIESLATRVTEAAARVPARGETVLLACPPRSTTTSDCGCCSTASCSPATTRTSSAPTRPCPRYATRPSASARRSSCCRPRRTTTGSGCATRSRASSVVFPRARLAVGGPAFAHDSETFSDLVLDPAELDLPGGTPAPEDG
jgi:hypothetical protein